MPEKEKKHDVSCKFNLGMFEMLVSGKEVIVEQPDGSKWHFTMEDVSYQEMSEALDKAKNSGSTGEVQGPTPKKDGELDEEKDHGEKHKGHQPKESIQK